MFSSTTIESSTKMPMISVIASNETVSSVKFATLHGRERHEQRGRDRDHDDDRVAPRAQEEQHHDRR